MLLLLPLMPLIGPLVRRRRITTDGFKMLSVWYPRRTLAWARSAASRAATHGMSMRVNISDTGRRSKICEIVDANPTKEIVEQELLKLRSTLELEYATIRSNVKPLKRFREPLTRSPRKPPTRPPSRNSLLARPPARHRAPPRRDAPPKPSPPARLDLMSQRRFSRTKKSSHGTSH